MNFSAIKIKLASPEEILSWSYGEVVKPETINYRTQRPEKDGLFSERIFGPTKDYECYCGKYKKIRYKGTVCDRCGVEVTRAVVRRERMGHIKLAAPVSHVWFLRSAPSKIGLLLNAPLQRIERVIYYAAYIVTSVDDDARKEALKELKSGNQSLQIKDFLSSLRVGKTLSDSEYADLSRRFGKVFKAGRGAEAVRKALEKIDLKKTANEIEKQLEETKDSSQRNHLLQRLKMARSFFQNKLRPEWMILTVLPVLPPDLRPMVALDGGRYATSDLNELYRRVINRNNRLKKLIELKSPDIIVANEKRMLQEAVDALIDNTARFGGQPQLSSQRRPLRSLADILKGKQGRFRQTLLGKRVDYSGRSVIVVGPELKLYQCGLPKKMALELFRPFVINKIIEKGMAHNIRNSNRLIEAAAPEIWEILEEVIANRKVLLNRAPTLHRLGIQAFEPVLIEDLAIRIPPMVCVGFNADFDGDQMAVHLPLTQEAQKEASELMLSIRNILKPATGSPATMPSQDILLGCYCLTKIKPKDVKAEKEKEKIFGSIDEALMAYEFGYLAINEEIGVNSKTAGLKDCEGVVKTSVGRLIFNGVLPKDFRFVNEVLNRKNLQKVVAEFIKKHGIDKTWSFLDEIKKLGFYYSSFFGVSWAMSDLVVPQEKEKIFQRAEKEIHLIESQYREGLLTDSERKARVIGIWEKAKSELRERVPSSLDLHGSTYSIIDSGARGSWEQLIQMTGMKGLIQNPKGDVIELPIKSSYKEGLGVLEFFINTHSARKGLIDTALKTAEAGYLTRRLVDAAHDLIIQEKDCRTTEGIEIVRADGESFGYKFSQRLFGRTTLEDVKIERKIAVKSGEVIDWDAAQAIEKSKSESLKIRSPITCKTAHGVCSKCYGFDLGRNEPVKVGEAIGVIAAQSIGEPGTQLTLRTFHVGGVAGVDITHGLPRIQELFETRIPKGKAALTEVDGVIEDIEERDSHKIIKLKTEGKNKKTKLVEYPAPRMAMLFVKIGDKVKKGDQLYEGSVDLQELFRLKGQEAVQSYLINEIQKIYVSEGTIINDKHIETIVKQMFSRVLIKESGDTDFVPGEIVPKSKFVGINKKMKKQDKQPAKAQQMLVGITKAALSTESFLSAASFQETAKVLVKAAVEAKVDNLRGLKENVIVGKLIPAGTGYQKKSEEND